MWVIGGADYDPATGEFKILNDVWSSSDGVVWTQATAAAAFPARSNHTSVVLGNKMWIIGGSGKNGYLHDVWSSSDGVTWTQATPAAAFSARSGHTSVVLGNKMWVIGGDNLVDSVNDTYTYLHDVWSSSDGCVTWT